MEEQEIRQQTVDLLGHVNRAITKYSYGIPAKKDRFIRLQTLATEPWKIYYKETQINEVTSKLRTDSHDQPVSGELGKEVDAGDFFQYLSILREIQSAITKGTIDLKDSEKVRYYLEQVLEFLPSFNSRLNDIRSRVHSLKEQKVRLEILWKFNTLEDGIKEANEAITEKRRALELLEAEVSEKQENVDNLISKSQSELFKTVGQPYDIIF
jgi:hypothetical protein